MNTIAVAFAGRLLLIRAVLQAAVLLLTIHCFGAPAAEPDLTKTFPAKPGGSLLVDADRGSIDVATTAAQEVTIEVQRKVTGASDAKAKEILAAHQVTFEQKGNSIQVHARLTKKLESTRLFGRQPNLEVRYRITLPAEFNLDLRTSAGSVSCADIKGKVKARTAGGSLKFASVDGPIDGTTSAGSVTLASASGRTILNSSGGSIKVGELGADGDLATSAGSIAIKKAAGNVSARTSGGSIDAGELMGPAELQTSAGSIHVKTAHQKCELKTSGGNITIEDAKSTLLATTAAGSVTAAFTGEPREDCRLVTSGGNIKVQIAEGVGFDVKAKATGGRITTDIPVATTVVGRHNPAELNGKLNDGGKALVLQTTAGSISIQKP